MTHPDAQYISGTPELQEQVKLLGITWRESTTQWLLQNRYFVAPITIKYLVEETIPILKRYSIIEKDGLTVKPNHLVSSIMRFLGDKSMDIIGDVLSRQNADFPSLLPQLKNKYKGLYLTFIARSDHNELMVFHGNRQEPKLIVHCEFNSSSSIDTISGYVDSGITHFNKLNDYAYYNSPEVSRALVNFGIYSHNNTFTLALADGSRSLTTDEIKYILKDMKPILEKYGLFKEKILVHPTHLLYALDHREDQENSGLVDKHITNIIRMQSARHLEIGKLNDWFGKEALFFKNWHTGMIHGSYFKTLDGSIISLGPFAIEPDIRQTVEKAVYRAGMAAQPVPTVQQQVKDEERTITQTKTDDEYYYSVPVRQVMATLNIMFNEARKEYTLKLSSINTYVLDLADTKYVINTLVPILKTYGMYKDGSLILNAHLSYAIANRKYDTLSRNGAIPRAIQDIMVMQQQDYSIVKELCSIFTDKMVFWVNCLDHSLYVYHPHGTFASGCTISYYTTHREIVIDNLRRIVNNSSRVKSVPSIPELREKDNIMPPETNVEVQSVPVEKTNMVRIKKLGTRTFDNVQFGLKLKGVAMANRKTVQLTIAAFGEDRPKWVDSERAQAVMLMIGPTVLQVVNLMIEDKESVPDMLKTLIKEAADLGQIDAAAELTETTLMPLVILVSEIVKNYLVAVGGKAAANLLTADMITGLVSSVFNAEAVKELK